MNVIYNDNNYKYLALLVYIIRNINNDIKIYKINKHYKHPKLNIILIK